MLTRHAITQRADLDGVDALVAERDYVLAHIISQLHRAYPQSRGLTGGLRDAHHVDSAHR